MDGDSLRKSARYSGDPWVPRNPYFAKAEESMAPLWERLIWPFISDCDFESVVDLAAGHGRNSEMLLRRAKARHVVVMDIQPGNIEVCMKRFRDEPNVWVTVCNGFDLSPIRDQTQTLIYCFDAMVHFNPDVVQSYLKDTYRALRLGGRGFFHHSNQTDGRDWRTNPGSRNYMSANLFEEMADRAKLSIIRQKPIDWGHRKDLDCLTLVEKR